MLRILSLYLLVAACISIYNMIQFLRCRYIIRRLIRNLCKKIPNRNCNYCFAIESLLRKTHVDCFCRLTTENMADESNVKKVTENLLQAKGVYRHRSIHSFTWPIRAIEHMRILVPVQKIPNKLLSVILAILEGFVLYLLGLFLDTTGTGNKILTFLLAFLSALPEHLADVFH